MPPNSSMDLNTTYGKSTAQNNPNFCYLYTRTTFETLDTTSPYIVNAAINIPSALIAFFANTLVFLAICRSTSIRLPSKLLLCSLVLTDLAVGLIAQPLFILFLIMKVKGNYSIACTFVRSFKFAGSTLVSLSLLTMTAISLDRYTALFSHINYHGIVTTKRVSVILAFIWSFSVFYAWTSLLNRVLWVTISLLGLIICIIIISVACIKIYQRLRGQRGHQVQDQQQAQAQQQAGATLNITKFRRTASAMLRIYALFLFSYLPTVFIVPVMEAFSYSVLAHCIYEFCNTLLLLNSCFNPFVYCFCLPDIRAEVLKLIRRIIGRSPS